MELHERLTTARSAPTPGRDDPFAEIKNRVHMAVIGDLGPQLFNVSMDPIALRERVLAAYRLAMDRAAESRRLHSVR